jgi:hypothetical protein
MYIFNGGWFMTLWHEQLFTNENLDDWAKISLSFLLMPDIDLEMQNDYFLPFKKGDTELFPNTLENFMAIGADYNSSLLNPFIKQYLPWAKFSTLGKEVELKPEHLKKALLGHKRYDYVIEFIDAINEAKAYEKRKGTIHYQYHSRVEKTALNTLINFVKQHTKLRTGYDTQLEIGGRPGIPAEKKESVRFFGGDDSGE